MVGPRPFVAALPLLLLALPAQSSLVEDTSGGAIAYQFDADNHHDAPDDCDQAHPAWSLPLGGQTDGLLVPPDDTSDAFVLDVPASVVGRRIQLSLLDPTADLLVDALAPSCGGSVLEPWNQPHPYPEPPAPSPGEVQAMLPADAEPVCRGDQWFFVLTRMKGVAEPASIHVAWSDGSEASVPLVFRNGEFAVYGTTQSVAYTLTGAWANVRAGWDGELVLAMEPEGTTDGGAVYGEPARLLDDRILFTPVRAGPHVVLVALAPPSLPPVPTSVPMSCHSCVDGTNQTAEKASYILRSDPGN